MAEFDASTQEAGLPSAPPATLATTEYMKYLLQDNPDFHKMPGVTTALAMMGPQDSPNPNQNAQAASGFYYMSRIKKTLEQSAPDVAVQHYQQLDPYSRAMLLHMGYQEPTLEGQPQEASMFGV